MSEHEQEEKQEKREKSEEEQEARTHARKSKNPTQRCGEKFGKEWWGSEGENGKGIEWGQSLSSGLLLLLKKSSSFRAVCSFC